MYQELEVKIEGLTPTLMRNGQLSDPLNEWAKQIAIKAKEPTTDEQQKELARLEFMGSLYVNEHGAPIWPGENIEAMIIGGAKKASSRGGGAKAKVGIMVEGDFPLKYEGPKDMDDLWTHGGYMLRASVRIGKARVMRTRPIFRKWSLDFTVKYIPAQVNPSTVLKWIDVAGAQVGLSDWRPKFGRFVRK